MGVGKFAIYASDASYWSFLFVIEFDFFHIRFSKGANKLTR